jgi:tyrosinase
MAARYIRRDIWNLEKEETWHPITRAYALAIGVMQERDDDPEDPTSWSYQAAIHGVPPGEPFDQWRNQCQHNTWFFLPWHRLYLYWFERIVRSIVETHEEVSEQTRATWALPYWNYSRLGEYATLPPTFRDRHMDDGRDNPLYVEERRPAYNAGAELDKTLVTLAALDDYPLFTDDHAAGATAGFGGPPIGWHHSGSTSIPGALERTPHGDVHVQIGGDRTPPSGGRGFMSLFETAGLDPIFWLHHANIDRLWVVWHNAPVGRLDPTDAAWTRPRKPFDFHDEAGRPKTGVPADAVDTATLGYTYEDVSYPTPPRRRRRLVPPEPQPDHPPELVGATAEPLQLTGRRATVEVTLAAPTGPRRRAGQPDVPNRVYLNLEDVEGESNQGLSYAIYLNAQDRDDAFHVGNVSFFGIEQASNLDVDHPGGHGLSYAFDVTSVVDELREEARWTPEKASVSFLPVAPELAGGADAAVDVPPIKIGRVSFFYR